MISHLVTINSQINETKNRTKDSFLGRPVITACSKNGIKSSQVEVKPHVVLPKTLSMLKYVSLFLSFHFLVSYFQVFEMCVAKPDHPISDMCLLVRGRQEKYSCIG